MKDDANRPQKRTRLAWTLSLLLLPLAAGSGAQDSLRWRGASAYPPSPSQQPASRPSVHAVPQPGAAFDPAEFETLAQQLVADGRVPGLAMAIVQNGKVVSERGYGVTDAKGTQPIDNHTVFRLASLSKAFASALTGLMVDEGKFRWDTPVVDYVPWLRLSRPGAERELTVADLLSHRVGLTRNAFDRDLEANADYSGLVSKLAYAPMTCNPGECYAYQNVAFSLIGNVLAATSGEDYGRELARMVFKPLGMKDASTGLDGIESSPRWARPHVRGGGGWVALMPKPAYYHVLPAAGVNASISDMSQWLIAQTGHRPDVLPAPLLATLHRPVISTPTELRGSEWRRERLTSAGYAIGWRVYDYAGHEVVFHGGAVQGYRGVVAMLPDRDLGVAILWNSESALPSGLLPTILDSAIGLPYHAWIEDKSQPAGLYASGQPNNGEAAVPDGSDQAQSPAAAGAPR
ncbi:beta-lactamase family protein [Pseudoluteimonas lycopersici]|uniref:Beta-lactamase family protein n=1 Tax=Pseudoluteimonas lycopersici TaxID=1324796 RepID=A0A516V4Z9_9GAMM|nr:beta-lactamase family protein [Lysobacter lycopersici]